MTRNSSRYQGKQICEVISVNGGMRPGGKCREGNVRLQCATALPSGGGEDGGSVRGPVQGQSESEFESGPGSVQYRSDARSDARSVGRTGPRGTSSRLLRHSVGPQPP